MIDWTITDRSNAMDIYVGYTSVLTKMRNFVRTHAAGFETINIHQTAGHQPPTTSLRMSADNFTVTHINGQAIDYNYAGLRTFYAADLRGTFPTGATAVNAHEKAKLLYLLPEAARSTVIENAFSAVLRAGGYDGVVLQTYGPLVNNYGHTCAVVPLDPASPARPLTAQDYRQYAATLAVGTPARGAINALCP